MDEISRLNSKLKNFNEFKQDTNQKIKELELNFEESQESLNNESKEKLEQIKNDYESRKMNLKIENEKRLDKLSSEFEKNKKLTLSKFNEEMQNIIDLFLETYKKALFTEFDRKRSIDRYNPKESKQIIALKEIIENNDFLPKESLEKINSLLNGEKSIDELMYELTS